MRAMSSFIKKVKLLPLLSFIFAAAIFGFHGCGGSAGPTVPSSPPISIEGLDGESGIPIDSSFKYTLAEGEDPSTITNDTLFLVRNSDVTSNIVTPIKAALDPTICQPSKAIAAVIECFENSYCTLVPENSLACSAQHTICVTVANEMYSFITEACPTALSITSITDAKSTAVAEGSIGVWPASFDIVFDAAVDNVTELQNSTTLACGDLAPAVTVAAQSAAYTYRATIADAHRYALDDCTLTLANSFAAAGGTISLQSSVSYNFTNACAVTDIFNLDSESCWTPAESADAGALTTWAAIHGVLNFSPATDTLNYTTYAPSGVSTASSAAIYKVVSASSAGYEIVIHFKSASFVGALNDKITAYLLSGATDGIYTGIFSVTGATKCAVVIQTAGGTAQATANCPTGSEYHVKIAFNGSSFSPQYSTDGTNYTALTIADTNASWFTSPSASLVSLFTGDGKFLGISTVDQATTSKTAEIDSIIVSGITGYGNDSGQY